MIQIVDSQGEQEIPGIRTLFREYAQWLAVDLCFQDFEAELATLPGRYAPPAGALLAAQLDDQMIGCVAMRPLSNDVCEMKRLWVRPAHRQTGIAKALVRAVIERAKEHGYSAMRLDTLVSMTSALNLYRAHGFCEIPAYYSTPLRDTVFLECKLASSM